MANMIKSDGPSNGVVAKSLAYGQVFKRPFSLSLTSNQATTNY